MNAADHPGESANYGMGLLPQHAQMLAASGISPEVAHARGYRSVTEKTRLEKVGITKTGRTVPGLLVPSLRPDGSVWGYQYRPDAPRLREGKPVKYETPVGQRNGIDVPPACRESIGDPSVPLWVAEGVKKADSGAAAGLCIVALPGVWSWRGSNEHGGKTAVPDWHDIALNDRRVVLAFDSDVVRKPAVQHALRQLAEYLGSKGAKVEFAHLPDDDAGKTGLDDYLAAGHAAGDLWALVRPEMPQVVVQPLVDTAAKRVRPADNAAPVAKSAQGPQLPEDGAALLDELHGALTRYVVLPSAEAADAVVLWIAASHAQRALNSAPRLVVKSPEKRCGKSRLLDVIEATCYRPFMTFNATVAAVVRSIDADDPPTLLVDEADAIWSKAKASEGAEDLRALLNAGFGRGRPVVRCVGPNSIPTEFPSFAMAALAGIGDTIPDTITDRAVIVRVRRRAPGESVRPFRQRRDAVPLHGLRGRLQTWATAHLAELGEAEPELPVEDRAADVWEPLVAVADTAGGAWPARARTACRILTDAAAEDDGDASLNLRLLADLRDVFEGHDRMHASTIVEALAGIEDAPWKEYFGRAFTPADLARRMKNYGVKAERQLWVGGSNRAGYTRDQLHDVWLRYLPPSSPARDAKPQVNPLAVPSGLAVASLDGDEPPRDETGAQPGILAMRPLGRSQALAPDQRLSASSATSAPPATRRPTCGSCGTVLHDGRECLRCRFEGSA